MKKLFTTLTFAFLLFSFYGQVAYGEQGEHNHKQNHKGETLQEHPSGIKNASCEDIINVKVNGLVCDFCARSLEKLFLKRADVEGIKVDLNKGMIKIAMKPGMTMDNKTLEKLIMDSGYNVTAINMECEDG